MSDAAVIRDEASAPFFDAAAAGRLVIRRCAGCRHWTAPYLRTGATLDRCPACAADGLEWAAASGRGTLVTWTVVHGADVHAVGVVELSEGPWLTARLDAGDDPLAAGMELVVEFDRPGGGEPVPILRPAWRSRQPSG